MLRLMRCLAVVAAVLGLGGVPAALAAAPGIVHLEFSGTFTDPGLLRDRDDGAH